MVGLIAIPAYLSAFPNDGEAPRNLRTALAWRRSGVRVPSGPLPFSLYLRSFARCQGLTWLHREDHPSRHAEGCVSEQHGCRDAPGAFRRSRGPDAHREGQYEQGIRDLVERNHEGSHRGTLSRQLTELLIGVAVARIAQGPNDITYDIQNRGDDTAAQQDLSYHRSSSLAFRSSVPLCHKCHVTRHVTR